MYILEQVPLNAYSTMRLGGNAAYLTEVNSRADVVAAVSWANGKGLPVIVIGGGSNIVWRDEGYPGLVIVNRIMGIEEQEAPGNGRYFTVGAGVTWDEFVAEVTRQGFTGVEFLSLIPGTVGGTPIQNVGAYGQEVANTIITLEAFDLVTNQLVNLRSSDCKFTYRSSMFKEGHRRYIITAVTFSLQRGNPQPPFYGAVQTYLDTHQLTDITPQQGRDATIAIRSAKLPDPKIVANTGSFFANPVISTEQYFNLQNQYPELMHWMVSDNQVKLSAAWLIEKAGFKDHHDPETGMATWPTQPLVLVNESAHSSSQLCAYRDKIIAAVQNQFGVTLTQEPEILPEQIIQ